MTSHRDYPLLSTIDDPADLRRRPASRLKGLAGELRAYPVHSVSSHGGHFAAGLGTIDLTIALHYVFNTPEDRFVWDVGHQCYPHKILTGRRDPPTRRYSAIGCATWPRRTIVWWASLRPCARDPAWCSLRRAIRTDISTWHRRTAGGDLRRRPRLRGPEAGGRHLFDLSVARLRPVDSRRRCAKTPRPVRH